MTEFVHSISRVISRAPQGACEGFLPEAALGWLSFKSGFAVPGKA